MTPPEDSPQTSAITPAHDEDAEKDPEDRKARHEWIEGECIA
jgi:hypothetical protein